MYTFWQAMQQDSNVVQDPDFWSPIWLDYKKFFVPGTGLDIIFAQSFSQIIQNGLKACYACNCILFFSRETSFSKLFLRR